MANSGRIRVRGAPRNDIDLHLIAQVILIWCQEMEEAAASQGIETPPAKTTKEYSS